MSAFGRKQTFKDLHEKFFSYGGYRINIAQMIRIN